MSKALTEEQILAALDRSEVETEPLNVPELGGMVWVREMPGTLRNQLEAASMAIRAGGSSKSLDKINARIISSCTVDEHGNRIMSIASATSMLEKRAKVAFRIRDKVIEVSGTDEDDIEAMTEVFGGAQSDSSTSD